MVSGSIEEMNERNLMKAICTIEQKLLIEDESPSIHNPDEGKKTSSRQVAILFALFCVGQRFLDDALLLPGAEISPPRPAAQAPSSPPGPRERPLPRDSRSFRRFGRRPHGEYFAFCLFDSAMRYCVQTLSRYDPPPDSIPLRADIRTFDWERLAKAQRELTGRLFDVIMMDPPWQLATANPTRGVAIAYEQLGDDVIRLMPLDLIQTDGYLFLWVINAKYRVALDLLEGWGYTFVDEIAWVKCNRSRRLAKSHGFYLQHSKETCLVAKKVGVEAGLGRRGTLRR